MKRFLIRYLPLLLSLTAVFAIVGSTYAYLAATDNEIINSFKFAQIDTSTNEKTENYNEKEVTFSNNGSSSVYIRARVLVSAGDVGATAVRYDNSTQPGPTEISVIWNSSDWTPRDGWFYYNQVLEGHEDGQPIQSTAPLIYQVLVGDGLAVDGASFEVDVYEESVLTSATGTVNVENAAAAFGGA